MEREGGKEGRNKKTELASWREVATEGEREEENFMCSGSAQQHRRVDRVAGALQSTCSTAWWQNIPR